jgi:hypothetical protein
MRSSTRTLAPWTTVAPSLEIRPPSGIASRALKTRFKSASCKPRRSHCTTGRSAPTRISRWIFGSHTHRMRVATSARQVLALACSRRCSRPAPVVFQGFRLPSLRPIFGGLCPKTLCRLASAFDWMKGEGHANRGIRPAKALGMKSDAADVDRRLPDLQRKQGRSLSLIVRSTNA